MLINEKNNDVRNELRDACCWWRLDFKHVCWSANHRMCRLAHQLHVTWASQSEGASWNVPVICAQRSKNTQPEFIYFRENAFALHLWLGVSRQNHPRAEQGHLLMSFHSTMIGPAYCWGQREGREHCPYTEVNKFHFWYFPANIKKNADSLWGQSDIFLIQF